jgi:uncharacterized membrane protein
MILLGLGVILFAICHLPLAVPQAKDALRQRFGKYSGLGFGLLSLVPLVLIILGWRMSPFVPIYDPPSWGRIVTFVLVLAGFLCLGVFLFRGRLRQVLRFPLAWGVVFWSVGHLFANGDAAGLIFFGGMLIYALAHLGLGVANNVRPSPVLRQGHDVISLLMGAALCGAATQLHPLFAGVPILPL